MRVEIRGAEALDLTIAEARDPDLVHPFKGNVDLPRLEAALADPAHKGRIPFVLVTVTCNSTGGQPVSMENIRGVSEICRRHHVPLFFDAARFAENAWFIRSREAAYRDRDIRTIAHEMFSYGQGCTMSARTRSSSAAYRHERPDLHRLLHLLHPTRGSHLRRPRWAGPPSPRGSTTADRATSSPRPDRYLATELERSAPVTCCRRPRSTSTRRFPPPRELSRSRSTSRRRAP
jgi:hypothetical protein